MGIDIVKEVGGMKNAYGRLRGAAPNVGKKRPDGSRYMPSGFMVPQTTYADVMLAQLHITKFADPDVETCISLLQKEHGANKAQAQILCPIQGPVNPMYFVRTRDFKRAKKDFTAQSPLLKIGIIQSAMRTSEVYPHNEEFWGAALRYAIERSAAGAVPFWQDMAMDSIKESVKELPGNVAAAISKLDPRGLIPNLSPLADIIKWGSIGGGLFMLYWYVLKPADKKKSKSSR